MDQLKAFFGKYWHTLAALAVLLLVIYLIYRAGKNSGSGNTVVIDDTGNVINPTPIQTEQANELSNRIHADLTSGTFFGLNFFGTIGRDTEAYDILTTVSDTMFRLVYQSYKDKFGTSMIADLRAESSISDATQVQLILDKANRLRLV